jgi:asparagine synthase (glutamine-hydrolysing)
MVGPGLGDEARFELGLMIGKMKHHPWYVENRHVAAEGVLALGRVSLGSINQAAQPAANEDGSVLAMMEGEVFDLEEQRRALQKAGHQFRGDSQAELLVHGYEQRGKEFFQGLNGTFVASLWDARKRRLFLVNDRFGMKPLYYAQLPDRLLFASEIKALLTQGELSRQPSFQGLAQFFTFGQLLGEDTLLKEVRALPAAAWLIFDGDKNRLVVERYWRLETAPNPCGSSEQELLDRIDEAFAGAVQRRCTGANKLGISLSGGLDARTILGVLGPEHPVTSVCMGLDGSMDHRIAEQLARFVNADHHPYILNSSLLGHFEEHLREMVHLTDGHFLSQCIVMPTLPFYRQLGIDVLLRGHAGELMHMDKAYSFSLDKEALALRDEPGLERWLMRRLPAFVSDEGAGPLFGHDRKGEMETLARDSLRECLRESADTLPVVQRIWHLFITQRLRREVALSMVKFGSQVEIRLPYLDNEVVDLLMAAPPKLKLGERIQVHILRRRRPEFLKVVNVNTGTRLGASRLAKLLAAGRKKVLAKLGVRGYQPYERLGKWLREELRPLVEMVLLDKRCLERGIFYPPTVRAIVHNHWSGRRNHTFLIMAMLIFEMSQREFIDGDGFPKVQKQRVACLG